MADNPYVNKVEYGGRTLMDLTGDTATPSDVLSGVSFHDRSGAAQQGSLITHNVYDGLDSTSTSDALSANQGKVLNGNLNSRYIFDALRGTNIESNTDLNNMETPGIYYCTSSATAQTLSNCPVTSNFSMLVLPKSQSYVVQLLFANSAAYLRGNSSNGFGNWTALV